MRIKIKKPKITIGKNTQKAIANIAKVALPAAATVMGGPMGGMIASGLVGGQGGGMGGLPGILSGALGGGAGGGLGGILSNPALLQAALSGDWKAAGMAALGSLGQQYGVNPSLISGLVGGGGYRYPAGGFPEDDKGAQNAAAMSGLFGGAAGLFGGIPGLQMGLTGLGAYADYDQFKKRWEERRNLVGKQRQAYEEAGKDYQAMKYDPERYKDFTNFLSQRISGGGETAAERAMRQESDIRAGRAGAAQRAAALQQMARMGGAMTGSGAALASALAGGQSTMDIISEANLEREKAIQKNLEEAYSKKAGLSTQATKEESELAQNQAKYRLDQLEKIATQRDLERALQEEIGKVEGAGLQRIAGTAVTALDKIAEAKKEAEKKPTLEKTSTQTEAGTRTPASESTPTKVPPPPGPTQSQINQALNRGSYTIKSGDTLSKRYADLGYNSWQEAYEANKDLVGDNPHLIKTGQTLRRKDELQDKRVTPGTEFNNKWGSNIA